MTNLILASGSKVRASLLKNAGVDIEIVPSAVDEAAVKKECTDYKHDVRDIAMRLAQEKALAVSADNPGKWVIGADQILGLGDRLFDKPLSVQEAAERLKLLSGQTHVLYSATCVAKDSEIMWQVIRMPQLSMLQLSDQAIDAYLKDAGEQILASVGAYELEGRGARLFREIEGDYFSILGLPLIPLLAFLREQKLVSY